MTANIIAVVKSISVIWPLFLIVVVGLTALLLMRQREVKSLEGRYVARACLLTNEELLFYQALRLAVKRDLLIFTKVRLEDLVEARHEIEQWQEAREKIFSKHIDFVLCDPRSVKPLVLIELNESSDNWPRRLGRDGEVRTICESCGLTLLEIPVKKTYEPAQLRSQILSIVKPQTPVGAV